MVSNKNDLSNIFEKYTHYQDMALIKTERTHFFLGHIIFLILVVIRHRWII